MRRLKCSRGRAWRVTALPLILIAATACQTTATRTSAIDTRAACEAFPAISYSRQDTPETRRQIVQHNAANAAVCAATAGEG